jgi:O-antigen/teichoic acid export membrane protein
MSQLRRQSIISSAVVYIGFALGLFNTYLFVRSGGFTKAQYGITGLFMAIASTMFSFANIGITAFIYKFFPYYKDNLSEKKNDQLTISLTTALIGFLGVIIGGYLFKDFFARKFFSNTPQLVNYYFWLFPFGFGLIIFSVLEAFAWQLRQSVFTNFLKEILFRLFTTILIVFTLTGVVKDYNTFVHLFSFTYLGIALVLFIYLIIKKQIHFTLTLSRVTKKFKKKILILAAFVYGGGVLINLANVFDSYAIAGVLKNGAEMVAIYTLAQNIGSMLTAPQRGINATTTPILSQAWKDKDMSKIQRIYQSTAINQLIFATAIFSLIWLNFSDGIYTFKLQQDYLNAQQVFLFIGIMRIIDMGTGVNAQIIGTSTFWRFEFLTGMLLLAITLPTNYILTKKLGITGPAIANLFCYTLYNIIRYVYLYKKFKLQPFGIKNLYTILLAGFAFCITYILYNQQQGFVWLFLRSCTFISIFASGVVLLKLSPDVAPVWVTIKKRLGIKKGDH